MTAPRVVVVGDIVTDILAIHSGAICEGSDTPARISVTGGGSAANTAAWLAWYGVPVDLVGVVGADPAGAERVAELTSSGVGCVHVRRTSRAATGSVIVLAHESERSMLYDRGANASLERSDVDTALDAMPDATHLHLSGYTLLDEWSAAAGRHALASASARGLTTSVDAASSAPLHRLGGATFLDWVRESDVLLANVAEARALLERDGGAELADALASRVRRAVVKLGADGAVVATADGQRAAVPAQPASIVDPTGAGDAFAAGFLAAWLGGETAERALVWGARLGARAVEVVGGRPPRDPRPLLPVRQVPP